MYQVIRPPTSTFVTLRGCRYHLLQWGEPDSLSPPMVLAHGWMDVGASWQFMVDAISPGFAAQRRIIAFAYTREDGAGSRRRAWPLGLHFWSGVWTLSAWCETRDDFRTFRLDRMSRVEILDARFRAVPGRTLADHLKRVAEEVDP